MPMLCWSIFRSDAGASLVPKSVVRRLPSLVICLTIAACTAPAPPVTEEAGKVCEPAKSFPKAMCIEKGEHDSPEQAGCRLYNKVRGKLKNKVRERLENKVREGLKPITHFAIFPMPKKKSPRDIHRDEVIDDVGNFFAGRVSQCVELIPMDLETLERVCKWKGNCKEILENGNFERGTQSDFLLNYDSRAGNLDFSILVMSERVTKLPGVKFDFNAYLEKPLGRAEAIRREVETLVEQKDLFPDFKDFIVGEIIRDDRRNGINVACGKEIATDFAEQLRERLNSERDPILVKASTNYLISGKLIAPSDFESSDHVRIRLDIHQLRQDRKSDYLSSVTIRIRTDTIDLTRCDPEPRKFEFAKAAAYSSEYFQGASLERAAKALARARLIEESLYCQTPNDSDACERFGESLPASVVSIKDAERAYKVFELAVVANEKEKEKEKGIKSGVEKISLALSGNVKKLGKQRIKVLDWTEDYQTCPQGGEQVARNCDSVTFGIRNTHDREVYISIFAWWSDDRITRLLPSDILDYQLAPGDLLSIPKNENERISFFLNRDETKDFGALFVLASNSSLNLDVERNVNCKGDSYRELTTCLNKTLRLRADNFCQSDSIIDLSPCRNGIQRSRSELHCSGKSRLTENVKICMEAGDDYQTGVSFPTFFNMVAAKIDSLGREAISMKVLPYRLHGN